MYFINMYKESGVTAEMGRRGTEENGGNGSEIPTYKEFLNVVASLKIKKAVGLDWICNEMVKHDEEELIKKMYNWSFRKRRGCIGLEH